MIGIVTRRDLLRVIATDDATVLAAVRSRLACYAGADRWDVAQVIAESVPGVAAAHVCSRASVR